ncbi:tubulin-tyrosine ligase family-domain-containing protein [Phlebopus sp. FC_14]|nr:tubulin-tyrosine ligase family-domain-containing protein [Phlebopus sp. FC_14]
MNAQSQPMVFVYWPAAPLTESLVRMSLTNLGLANIVSSVPTPPLSAKLVQWATYDHIDHVLTASDPDVVLSSSYTIRKALIRKHFLARCIQSYLAKHSDSFLTKSVPRTWDVEISHADELDELWSDELWELNNELEMGKSTKWYILKPGMADRGMGIRMFHDKNSLYRIFLEFDGDHEDEETDDVGTSVMTSQLRHFVIQEYLSTPLLLDPYEISRSAHLEGDASRVLQGYKFHLRSYVVTSGAIAVYMYEHILALFSAEAYREPSTLFATSDISLGPHLTNTSLQTRRGEEGVRLLDELIGCHILSCGEKLDHDSVLRASDILAIKKQMAVALSETFKASLEQPVHFQPLPNAFELYGIDFLVSHEPTNCTASDRSLCLQVKLLEINAEPAIELTGPRLSWILEDLFKSIGRVCIQPFFDKAANVDDWGVGEVRYDLRKCLDTPVRCW